MRLSSVFAMLMLAQMSSGWVRFREPDSRRIFLNQTLIEKLQNCAGKQEHECGLCGEGQGEIQTNVIPTENYTVVDPDVRVLAVELGFRAGLNGYLEFRVCNVTDNSTADGIACNKTTPLLIGSNVKWYPALTQSSAKSRFRLPHGLVCERCVLQVKYTPGPNSTMKDFRFFDCTLLNITHPTKVSKEPILTSREPAPRQVFPPDHSVLDGRHISTFRSENTVRGQGNGLRQPIEKALIVSRNGLTNGRNGEIVTETRTVQRDGSRIIVRRLPSGERTASLHVDRDQSTGDAVITPAATKDIASGANNDTRVVITTKIFNLTGDINNDQSNADNQARITMINVQQNNMAATNNVNAAENELNGMQNIKVVQDKTVQRAQDINAHSDVETVKVLRNVVDNSLNKSVNIGSVNTVHNDMATSSLDTGNVEQRNNNVDGSSALLVNRTTLSNTQTDKQGTNTIPVVRQRIKNVTVDANVYNNQSVTYYDETYYHNNATGAYNDTYYYDDNVYGNNETFVSSIVDPVTSISNITAEGSLGDTANVVVDTKDVTANSDQSSSVSSGTLNENVSSGMKLSSERTVSGRIVVTSSDRSSNVNRKVSSINLGARTSSMRSAISGSNVVTSSDTSSGSDFELLSSKVDINSGMDSRVDGKIMRKGVEVTANVKRTSANQAVDFNVNNTNAVISLKSSKTMNKGLTQNNSFNVNNAFNKSSLINETILMMADLNGNADINTEEINQQIVSVPHTIVVLPKFSTLTRPGPSPIQVDTSYVSTQNASVQRGDQMINVQTRTVDYSTNKSASAISLTNQTQQNNLAEETGTTETTKDATHSIEEVQVGLLNVKTDNSSGFNTAENTQSNMFDTLGAWNSANSTSVSKNEINTFKGVASYNQVDVIGPTVPEYTATKRLFYAISAADRRPNYASSDIVGSSLKINPTSSDGQSSVNSLNSGTDGVFSRSVNQTETGSDHGRLIEITDKGSVRSSVEISAMNSDVQSPTNSFSSGVNSIYSETTGLVNSTQTKADLTDRLRSSVEISALNPDIQTSFNSFNSSVNGAVSDTIGLVNPIEVKSDLTDHVGRTQEGNRRSSVQISALNQDVQSSANSFNSRDKGVFSETVGLANPTETKADLTGRVHKTNTENVRSSVEISALIPDVQTSFNSFNSRVNSAVSDTNELVNPKEIKSLPTGRSDRTIKENDRSSVEISVLNSGVQTSINSLNSKENGVLLETVGSASPTGTASGLAGRVDVKGMVNVRSSADWNAVSPDLQPSTTSFDGRVSGGVLSEFIASPEYKATRRRLYAVSAADRRPNYASNGIGRSSAEINPVNLDVENSVNQFNTVMNGIFSDNVGSVNTTETKLDFADRVDKTSKDTVRLSMEVNPTNQNDQISTSLFNSRQDDVISGTIGIIKPTGTTEKFQGNDTKTNLETINSRMLLHGSRNGQKDINNFSQTSSTLQHAMRSNSGVTENSETAWDVRSSKVDISNQLLDQIRISEPLTDYQTTSLPHTQESITTVGNTVMLDISTRAFDTYIGLPSTTVDPLNMMGSAFVRLVNYSSVTANSIVPAPKHDTSSSISSALENSGSTESSLMSLFSSTPAAKPTISSSSEVKHISKHGDIVAENTDMFANLNFLGNSDATVDHLGGVPIQSGSEDVVKSQRDSSFTLSRNGQQSKTLMSIADLDISNTLGDSKTVSADTKSNEVVWKAAVGGFAIPVGNLSIDPDLRTEESIKGKIASAILTNNQSDLKETDMSTSGDKFIGSTINVNDKNRHNNSNNLTIGKTIIWQSMHLSNLSQTDKKESNINVPLPSEKDIWQSMHLSNLSQTDKKESNINVPLPSEKDIWQLMHLSNLSQTDKKESNINVPLPSEKDIWQLMHLSNLSQTDKKESNINVPLPSEKDIWQLMHLSNVSQTDEKESNINIRLPSEKNVKTARNLDISINGNAAINRIASTKNGEGTKSVNARPVTTPIKMPPITVKTDTTGVNYNFRDKSDMHQIKIPVSRKQSRNITFFTPYLINRDNKRQSVQRIQHMLTNGKSEHGKTNKAKTKLSGSVFRTVNKPAADITVSNNLTVSTNWDINRGNTFEEGGNRTEILPTVQASNVLDSYTVYSIDGSNTDSFGSRPKVESTANNVKDSRDVIVVEDKSGKDVNTQVLRTLEALVLELEAIEMKSSHSRRPIVNSSVQRSLLDRTSPQEGNHNSYPVFSVHQNLLTVPNDPVYKKVDEWTPGSQRGTDNHRLLNMLGISNQRDWNSDINLNHSIGTDNKNGTIDKYGSTQQIVNLSEVRSRASDQFATLLNSFADISRDTVLRKEKQTKVKPTLTTSIEKSLIHTEIAQNSPSVIESKHQLTNSFDNGSNGSSVREQTVIGGAGSLFLNPFTRENITFSRSDKKADKFIVRGVGNLKHLKNVEGLYSPNFTVTGINFTPSVNSSDVISIEGKYLYGQMRRNDMGQFEPVPLASNFDASVAEESLSSNEPRRQQENKTNNANMIGTTLLTGLSQQSLYDKLRTHFIETANQNSVLSGVNTGSSNRQFPDTTVENRKNPVNGKVFFNQNDLLKTNGIFFNEPTQPAADMARRTNAIRLEGKANNVSCTPDEMFVCSAVGKNRYIPGMVWWCFSHCKNGVCPPEKCACRCDKIQKEQKSNTTNVVNVSGSKRRKKVIHLTLNTQAEKRVPAAEKASEQLSRRSKSDVILTDVIRPKVLNATVKVTKLKQTQNFPNESDNVIPIQLFQKPTVKCIGINAFANTTGMDDLCTRICLQNMCPEAICKCF